MVVNISVHSHGKFNIVIFHSVACIKHWCQKILMPLIIIFKCTGRKPTDHHLLHTKMNFIDEGNNTSNHRKYIYVCRMKWQVTTYYLCLLLFLFNGSEEALFFLLFGGLWWIHDHCLCGSPMWQMWKIVHMTHVCNYKLRIKSWLLLRRVSYSGGQSK